MTIRFNKILIIILCYAGIGSAFGQSQKNAVRWSTRTFTERDQLFGLNPRPIDTISNRMEIFSPVNRMIVFNDLGNIGLPAQSLQFNYEQQTGFNGIKNPYEVYFIQPQKTVFINTLRPYTDITYAQGSGELLFLKVKHAQNILPRWNAGIELNRITSKGLLLRQLSSFYGVNLFTSFSSKEQHYQLIASAVWNFGNNDESGGVKSDSSFESLTGSNKAVYTNLAASSTKYHNRNLYIRHMYRFGKGQMDKDSVYTFSPRSQITHTLQTSELSFAFTNNGDYHSRLIPNQFYDTGLSTYDSVYYGKISNKLEWQLLAPDTGSKRYRYHGAVDSVSNLFSIGLRHELINAAQPAYVRQYQNLIAEVSRDIVSRTDYRTTLHVGASYVLSGYNATDYKLDAMMRTGNSKITLSAAVIIQRIRPDFFYQFYKTNQFIWNNFLFQTSSSLFSVSLRTNTWRQPLQVTAKLWTIDGYTYLDQQCQARQLKTGISFDNSATQIVIADVSKTIQIGKVFLEHLIIFQHSNASEIRVPQWSGIIRYYFQHRFFGISKFQLGFEAYANSAYKGYGYSPSQHQFYLQDDVTFGNYPVINPFLVADIKRASAFLVYEHVNMDWIKSGMYYTAHYPIGLSTLRFGLRWRLYD